MGSIYRSRSLRKSFGRVRKTRLVRVRPQRESKYCSKITGEFQKIPRFAGNRWNPRRNQESLTTAQIMGDVRNVGHGDSRASRYEFTAPTTQWLENVQSHPMIRKVVLGFTPEVDSPNVSTNFAGAEDWHLAVHPNHCATCPG